AWVTLGSDRAVLSALNPWSNVWVTTSDTGQATSSSRYATTTRRSASRSPGVVLTTARHPSLDQVQQHDDHERDDEHDGGDHRGCREVVALDVADHPHRHDLGVEGQVARQQHQRAVLADRAGE